MAGFSHTNAVDKDVKNTFFDLVLVNPTPGGRVTLGIKINEQHALAHAGQGGGQVDGCGGFTHTTLLISYCNDTTHGAKCNL